MNDAILWILLSFTLQENAKMMLSCTFQKLARKANMSTCISLNFASLYVVNLLSYYLAYLQHDSLHDVALVKFASLQIAWW